MDIQIVYLYTTDEYEHMMVTVTLSRWSCSSQLYSEPPKLVVTSSLMVHRGRRGGIAEQKTDEGTEVPCRRSLLRSGFVFNGEHNIPILRVLDLTAPVCALIATGINFASRRIKAKL